MKNIIVKNGLWGLGLLLMLGVSVAAYGVSRSDESAEDSATVECPLTGEEVCKDQCPLEAGNQACCSGKGEPHLSGKSCCAGKSELGCEGEAVSAENNAPACCSNE